MGLNTFFDNVKFVVKVYLDIILILILILILLILIIIIISQFKTLECCPHYEWYRAHNVTYTT